VELGDGRSVIDAAPGSLRGRLRRALSLAMKEHDRSAVSAFRSALGAIDNAEAVDSPDTSGPGDGPVAGARSGLGVSDVPRRDLSEHEMVEIVRKEIAERASAADMYDRGGHGDRAARLRAEASALARQLGEAGT
jgi:hypothetical protein